MMFAKLATRDAMNPLVVVLLVTLELLEKRLVVVIPPVEEALVKVVCPDTVRLPDTEVLVVEALPKVVRPVTVSPVEEAEPSVV